MEDLGEKNGIGKPIGCVVPNVWVCSGSQNKTNGFMANHASHTIQDPTESSGPQRLQTIVVLR